MSAASGSALTDRVAIVTGRLSGHGVHAAVGRAEAGAHVVVVARRAEKLELIRDQIIATGRRCLAVMGDVAEPDTATRTVEAAMEAFGRVNVLLNNAGMGTAIPATREMPEQFRQVIDVNLEGSYWFAQACGRAIRPGSSIVNVSSVLGFTTAGRPQAAYASPKAAIVGLTRDLAVQWTGRKRFGVPPSSARSFLGATATWYQQYGCDNRTP